MASEFQPELEPGLNGSPPDTPSAPAASESRGDLISVAKVYEDEIDSLVKYFNDEEGSHVVPRHWRETGPAGSNLQRKKIVMVLEGSRLPFSALVKYIFDNLSGENDQDLGRSGVVTLASVRSLVLSLGERISFGITNPDTDVLEDDTMRSLWRWEVRDVKLLPKGLRDDILDRRRWRKKIAERIASISATIEALSGVRDTGDLEWDVYLKAKDALVKTDNESAIRSWRLEIQKKRASPVPSQQLATQNPLGEQSHNLTQEVDKKRRRSDPEEKERLRREKMLKRQQMENEKEQRRKEKEAADKKKQQEKEAADKKKQQQRQQEETEKEQKRKEREEGERKRQEKKLQDEAEKEQKREVERKKQLALKKQASFMDRFLVKKDAPSCSQTQPAEGKTATPPEEVEKNESACHNVQALETAAVVSRMDIELKDEDGPDLDSLWRIHVSNWLDLRGRLTSQKIQRWGVRRKPKVSVYKELRLQGTMGEMRVSSQHESSNKRPAESSSPASHLKGTREEFDYEDMDWKVNLADSFPSSPLDEAKKLSSGRFHHLRNKRRKLLQFDKSHRPPYYGTFSKKSATVGPRHPWKKDPTLDYDVDSDEEWEEEEPGESLSDVEKDEEDEKVENEEIEDDEDCSDEFVVPDGYLSENEGVAMEDYERGVDAEKSSAQSPTGSTQQNIMSLERLRKLLDNATDHALRSNHPLIVSNLGHMIVSEQEVQSSQLPSRMDSLCLEALRIRVLVPNLKIEAC